MVEVWGQCPHCRKPRVNGTAFAWCGDYAQWLHEKCALEHRARLTPAGDHLHCCGYWEDDHLLPSQHEGDFGWIRVEGETWLQRTLWTGKWLLFLPPADVDRKWEEIRFGTLRGDDGGELGYAAKVGDRTNLSRDGTHPCCVYTVDCRDTDDVQRVLINLRRSGFTEKVFYKDDAATDARQYGAAGVLYIATAASTELLKRRDPIPPSSPD